MAAPNIVGVATITGKTAVAANIATSASAATLENAAASDDVYKVNAILISNIATSPAADTTVSVFLRRNSADYYIVNGIDVPQKSTLDVLNKPLYLEEGDALWLEAGAANALDAVISYEVITD